MRTYLWVALLLVTALPARGETINTLSQAYALAWMRQPVMQAAAERENALRSRRSAANALTPEPPSIEMAARTDRWNKQRGASEQEIGLVLPLWLPGERSSSQSLADAEINAFDGRLAALRLQLAGELREAWWGWHLARNEQELAAQRVAAAGRLRDDVVRRVNAGDLSRADRHQAEGAMATAQAQQAEAESANVAARSRLHGVLGQLPTELGVIAEPMVNLPSASQGAEDHPSLRVLQARGDVSRHSLELARARSRNNPEIAVGTRRERAVSGEEMSQTWGLALRIPFSSGARHDARLAEANADLIENTVQYERERHHLSHQRATAEAQVLSARNLLVAAELRARLAIENRGFFEKSFRLGETDLPTRLRIENEAFEAERQARRAQINLAQSISAYRQALGLLPE